MAEQKTRSEFSKFVYDRMASREFRDLLAVQDPDGGYPIVPVLLDDPMSDLLYSIVRAGGEANVIISIQNGYTIMSASARFAEGAAELLGTQRMPEQTVREFLAQALLDPSDKGYRFTVPALADAFGGEGEARIQSVGA